MSRTNRDSAQWKMKHSDLQEWLKINKPRTIPSAKRYKRKSKYPANY